MPDYKKYINALRKCAKEHENDRTSTGHIIIISDLCRDTANLLEEQEPCEDIISRQAAKKALEDRFMELQKRHGAYRYETNFCLNTILELPPVTPQQKTGQWVTKSHGFPPEPTAVCSKCGFDRDFYIYSRGWSKIKYCPQCGKKMEKKSESRPSWIGKRCNDCGNEKCKSLGELPKGYDCALWQVESKEETK